MVFPIKANLLEFAADHLDRLLGKSCIDRFVHERCVTKRSHTDSTDQPQGGCNRGSPDEDWYSDDEQSRIQLGSCKSSKAQLELPPIQFFDSKEPDAHEDHVEQQCKVGKQAVDCEHQGYREIVAREVREIVIDSALDFSEIGRLGEAFEVKELGDGLEVSKSGRQRLGPYPFKAGSEIEARGQSLKRDVDSRHCWNWRCGLHWRCLNWGRLLGTLQSRQHCGNREDRLIQDSSDQSAADYK